ncbi:MAG: 1-acyl-sn-glycerol-3-phosphate acyltransferase, partial [Myxococcota bacterium]
MTASPSSSLPQPGEPSSGLLGRILGGLFDRVRLDEEAADRLRDAYDRGIVVHVFRASRLTDPLFLLFALRKLGLPRPRWIHDHYASTEPRSVEALIFSIEQERSAVLFLRRPRTWLTHSSTYTDPYVEALLEAQRRIDRPLLLLPETLQSTTRPVGLRPTLIDSVFGNREAPGRLREVIGFLWNHRNARFHVGAPVDLQAVLKREGTDRDAVTARKVRFSISHHLAREEQIRTGPMVRSMARTRQMVLNDPSVRRFIGQQAAKGKSANELEGRAQRLLRSIAADMRHGWLRVLDAIIDKVWRRIYDGIVVDQDGLAKVRRAARRGPVVLMPSHKSHIDYIVLSQVFFKDGLMPPLVAAGENLNFWPMGYIFRRSGAFFIRRSFSETLYAVVFSAYVRRLLKEGHALEFFIEGGRSRTGKLLPPRTGLLTWCVEPVL